MNREEIGVKQFRLPIFEALGGRWMLLTAGTLAQKGHNSMTVSWGGLGVLWDKPIAVVVVRPTRYTYRFMEQAESFTLSAFGPEYRDALMLCGTKSGRDMDKLKAAGLTPIPSSRIPAPGIAQAELILECRKIYSDDVRPERFLSPDIQGHYPKKDYHRFYLGEILAIQGTPAYRS